ncbi:MAG: acireductone synthase [Terriglobia bacterium]
MTLRLHDVLVQAIVLDIEGTTTSVEFVYQILFPYARARVKAYLAAHLSSAEVRADIAGLREEHAADSRRGLDLSRLGNCSPEAQLDSIVAYIHWLMDQERKSTPLKSLQGKIWEEGYRTGELRGQVFDDLPPALARWQGQKKDICIFSSGSVLAQKLLFAHTSAGDLTRFIREYFDTTTGAKRDPQSYRRIAAVLQRQPSEILFVSDVTAELDAARSAGLPTALCVRPGNPPQPAIHSHAVICTFDEIFP